MNTYVPKIRTAQVRSSDDATNEFSIAPLEIWPMEILILYTQLHSLYETAVNKKVGAQSSFLKSRTLSSPFASSAHSKFKLLQV
jgi:hypothetical protein